MLAAELAELQAREKQAGTAPDPSLDAFMRASAVQVCLHSKFHFILHADKPSFDYCLQNLTGANFQP